MYYIPFTIDYILYYTILYHTILYHTILYYTILYYTILYYYYYILCYSILYHNMSARGRGGSSKQPRTRATPRAMRRARPRTSQATIISLLSSLSLLVFSLLLLSISSVIVIVIVCLISGREQVRPLVGRPRGARAQVHMGGGGGVGLLLL